MMEALEERRLFSLLGIGAIYGLPATSIGNPVVGQGSVTYSASTHAFTISGAPISMILGVNPTVTALVGTPSNFSLTLNVDNAGNASSTASPNTDVSMSGVVTINGTTYSGTLLTGQFERFGYQASGGSGADNFDFQFHVTGGALAPGFFAGKDIGIALSDENSNFVDFNSNFSAMPVKGYIGTVPTSGSVPIVITGHKYLDQTGNGLSADDTTHPLAGVTIQLYKDVNGNGVIDTGDTVVATTVTANDGSYVFAGLQAGAYIVKEVQQTGYVETGPTSGTYAVNATSGAYTGLDFDNYYTTCMCGVSNVCYVINGCKTVSSLAGNVHQGDTIKATFTITMPETISFVSYTAPDNYFNANDASQQKIYSVATGTYTVPGTYSLTITVPQCDFQVDLVCGLPIDKFGPAGSNIFYHSECRFIDGDNGGCNPPSATNSSIAGTVYLDCNKNGTLDNGDGGIAGIKVTLTGMTANGQVTLTTTTDSNGNYKFSNLLAGTYTVSETAPDGYADGTDSAGSLGGTVTTDVISNIVLGANTYATSYNFGEINAASVCGNSGHGHCKVTLTGCDSLGRTCTYSCTTDSNGNYTFKNLCSGNYKVQECDANNNCTSNKSFCLDSDKNQGQCINVNTLCGTSFSSLISQLLALLASWGW